MLVEIIYLLPNISSANINYSFLQVRNILVHVSQAKMNQLVACRTGISAASPDVAVQVSLLSTFFHKRRHVGVSRAVGFSDRRYQTWHPWFVRLPICELAMRFAVKVLCAYRWTLYLWKQNRKKRCWRFLALLSDSNSIPFSRVFEHPKWDMCIINR